MSNRLFLAFCITLLLFLNGFAISTIIEIPADQSTIQAGINASVNGDTVLVSPGTYYENIDFTDKDIVLASTYLTTGDTAAITATIIDGNGSGSVISLTDLDATFAAIIGFTITNGHSTEHGGGINCSQANPIISYNIITENMAEVGGGGIASISNISPVISHNTITYNIGEVGGGLAISGGEVLVSNNYIAYNQSGQTAGGITCLATGTFEYNVVADNISNGYVGGIYFDNETPKTVNNCTIYRNRSSSGYGGIYCYLGDLFMTNTIVYGNTHLGMPDQVTGEPDGTYITYCDIEDGWVGDGNIDAYPIFCDTIHGDYHLRDDSPCAGAGAGGADIGALGVACELYDPCGDLNLNGMVDIGDCVYIVRYIFQGGPPPYDTTVGDVNCDGTCNIGDAIYLITYIFRSGPEPCASCE
ncbi:MAG: dockerin type I domain-containing protein [Candidatus Zixiibacteriota bacterium]